MEAYVENYLEGYHVPLIHKALDAEIDATGYAVTLDGRVAIHEAPLKKSDAVYEGLWALAWPNTGFNVYGSGVMVERMAPHGHDKTRLDYIYLTLKGEAVSDQTMAMSDRVLAEDRWVVERVQENLDVTRHEGGVAAFQVEAHCCESSSRDLEFGSYVAERSAAAAAATQPDADPHVGWRQAVRLPTSQGMGCERRKRRSYGQEQDLPMV